MDIKKFHKTATNAYGTLMRTAFSRINSEGVRKTLIYPVNFVAAYIISQGIILGSTSPFGLAFSAASGAAQGSVFALLGTTLGYLSVLDKINSLKYIACIILIYTAHFVFKGTSLSRKRFFAPCSVFVPTFCINLVFLADGGFQLFDTAVAISELTLSTACAYLFTRLRNFKKQESFSSPVFVLAILTFVSSLLIALSEIMLLGFVSLGSVLAAAVVSISGFAGGARAGCITGAVIGCVISLSSGSADCCMLYSLIGIISGIFSKKGRFICATSVFVTSASISAWLSPQNLLRSAFEFAVATVIFLLFCDGFQKKTKHLFAVKAVNRDIHLRSYASERLSLVGDAFRSLGGMLRDVSPKAPTTQDINLSSAFDRTANLLCKKCTLAKICWERDYSATKTALNDAGNAVKSSGELRVSDLPVYFSSRCIHIEKFITTTNRELLLMRCNHRIKNKTTESKRLLCKQYTDVADIFSSLASDISENAKNDENAELAISDLLTSRGILCDVAVYRDAEAHVNIHLCGRDLSDIYENFDKYQKPFCEALGTHVDTPKFTQGKQLDDILIREAPTYHAKMSAAVHRRAGSERSGDSGSFFKPANGKLAVILSDGMGSGRDAASESTAAISLLENLLKSGISPKSALNALSSALILKTEQTGTFATLDLMYTDMFTGNADFFKFGSAPTYIKRGRHIRRITSSALPAGITTENSVSADSTSISLIAGDFVIMASDGVADGKDDEWLIEALSAAEDASPKALADKLLAHALAKYGRADDMTVVVIVIEHNPLFDV